MNSYLECLDEIPHEWLIGPGNGSGSDSPSTEGLSVNSNGSLDRPPALERAIAGELAGLRAPGVPGIRITVPAADDEALALANMEFIRRMRALVQWAEPGRPVTQTGAMRRADTTAWMRHFGLRTRGEMEPPSMWDIRGIGQPWDLAIETGMLSLTTTKVRPGPTGSVFESDDPVAQVHLGRSIVNLLLLHALSRSPSVENAQPQISAIMLPLFALLCRPEGQDLGCLREIDGRLARALRAGDAAERGAALQCSAVLRELRALGQFGLLIDVDGTAQVPAGLRPAVVASINGPGAPLAVDHDTMAVPVVTDE
jgi:hypothetical protein